MSMARRIGAYVLVSVLMLAAGCAGGAGTSVERVLRLPGLADTPYSHVLVVGVAPSNANAHLFERRIAEELRNTETRAAEYYKIGVSLTEDKVRETAGELGIDAILVTRVEHIDSNVSVSEERTEIEVTARGGNLVDYFRYDYGEHTLPPTVGVTYDVVLVTDIYDERSGEKVYVIESRTMDAETAFELILDESTAIVEHLRKDGVVR